MSQEASFKCETCKKTINSDKHLCNDGFMVCSKCKGGYFIDNFNDHKCTASVSQECKSYRRHYIKIMLKAINVVEKRGNQYQGTSSVTLEDYFPHGLQSHFDLINLKFQRIRAMVESQQPPDNMLDSIIDLINYAAFMGCYILDQRKNELSD